MPPRNGASNGRHIPPPPTAGEVVGLYDARTQERDEARLRSIAETFRVLTRMEHQINIPETYRATSREVRTPYIRDAWTRIVAALTQNDWYPHFQPRTEGSDKANRAAGVAERWCKAACQAMDHAIGYDVPLEACRALVRDCESVIQVVHRDDAWATFPAYYGTGKTPAEYDQEREQYKKGAAFPFAWRPLDRLCYAEGGGEFGPDYCVTRATYPRRYLAERYRMRPDDRTGRLVGPGYEEDGRTIGPADLEGPPGPEGYHTGVRGVSVKHEYFDAHHWCCVIDGSMAPDFPRDNPYSPWLPFFVARPSEEPDSVLYSMLFLAPRMDELLTMWLNWSFLSAYPNPYLQDLPNSQSLPPGMMPPVGSETGPSAFTWKPGKMLEIPTGKQFAFMQPPPVGGDLRELAQVLRALVEIAGIPSIMRGSSLSGDSGYLANQMISAVLMQYKNLQRARERQLEQVQEFLCFFVADKIKQTVYVLGQGDEAQTYLGLRASGNTTTNLAGIDQLGPVSVNAPPDMSVQRQAMAMIAKQVTAGPADQRLYSRRAALEKFMGEEDPDAILDEIWVEDQIATNPAVNAVVVQNAVQRSGLLPPQQQNPASQLVGPDGVTPLLPPPPPGPPGLPPGIPGQAMGGVPVMPGAGMPFQPPPPQPTGLVGQGGRPAGMYPGLPPNPPNASVGP